MARDTSLAEDITKRELLNTPDSDPGIEASPDPDYVNTDPIVAPPSDQPVGDQGIEQPQSQQPAEVPSQPAEQPTTVTRMGADPTIGYIGPDGQPVYYDTSSLQQPSPQQQVTGGAGGVPKAQQVVSGPADLPEGTDDVGVTHYGYAGDAYWDENSGKGIGDRDNPLSPGYSVALNPATRQLLFGVDSQKSTGQEFQFQGHTYRDDDTSGVKQPNIDVYDPVYSGLDEGVSKEMAAARRQLIPQAPSYDVRATPVANLAGTGDTTGIANYFIKRGDDPITSSDDPRLTTISTGNQKWQVNQEAAPYLQGFVSDLAAAGAPVRSDGGWNYRTVAGTNHLSEHAYGGAIDISSEGRNEVTPQFRNWLDSNPGVLQQLENKWHIYGGERFGDLSHFEWGGVTGNPPEQAAQVTGRRGAQPQPVQPTVQKAQLPQTWEVGDQKVSGEELSAGMAQEQQARAYEVAQLAQATQNEQSVPGLINKLNDPSQFPGVSAGVRQQYQDSLKAQLTSEAQKTFNEPDPQKAYDKAMSNANVFTPIGETARLYQNYLAKSFNAWNQSAQTGEENTINQFINLINPNASPQQKVDFYHDLTDPSRSIDDRTHHVMALYSQIDPQISSVIQPQTLLDAIDHQANPQYVQQRQDFLKNEADQIAQREQLDPRLQGTAAGNTAKFVAQMGATISQFGGGVANPAGWASTLLGGSLMASELLGDTTQRIRQEHPEMSAADVKAMAETSTLAQIVPQAALILMPGGMAERALGGEAIAGISNPVARIGSSALLHSGIGAGLGGTQQIAANLAEGRPVMEGVPQVALGGVPYGVLGALHGIDYVPRETARPEAEPEPAEQPQVPSPPVTRPLTGPEVLGPETTETAPSFARDPIVRRLVQGEQVITPDILQRAIRGLPEDATPDELNQAIARIKGAELEAPREVRFEPGQELQQPGIVRQVGESPIEAVRRELTGQPAPTAPTPVETRQPQPVQQRQTVQAPAPVTIDPARVSSKYPSNTVHWVNTSDIEQRWASDPSERQMYIPEGGTRNTIGTRYQDAIKYVQGDKPFQAPEATITEDGNIRFDDGRHRFAAMRDLGQTQVPLALDEESVNNAKATGLLKPEGEKIAPAPEPWISEIANSYVQPKVEPGEIPPGLSKSAAELIARGTKMGPEEVNQHISDIMHGPDPEKQMAAVRVEEARLDQRRQQLRAVSEADMNNAKARLDADNAEKDWLDFHNGPMAKLKNTFHQLGRGMQGEEPVDLSTVDGIRKQFLEDNTNPKTGKAAEITPEMEQTMRKTADNVKGASVREKAVSDRMDQVIRNRKTISDEEAMRRIAENMKGFPCRV